jgi:CRP/FNR family transcriptional regulator
LFSEGHAFDYLYAVRSGTFKTYKITPEGDEQIIDFHLPGDLIGFNAVARGYYTCHAVALDTASVCAIRFGDLATLCMGSIRIQETMLKKISALMAREEDFLVTIGTKSATQRLASFLVTLSSYYVNRGFSSTSFTLPMSRTDIASYLSLAVETVSRTLTRLQHDQVISVKRNSVEIKNHERLHTLAGFRLAGITPTAGMIH